MTTWNTIDDQMQNSHNGVQKVLSSSEKTKGVFSKHKAAFGAAAFGLALMGASFFMPSSGSFQAQLAIPGMEDTTQDENPFIGLQNSMEEDTSFQSEAVSFDINPVQTEEVVETEVPEVSNMIPENDSEPIVATNDDIQEVEETSPVVAENENIDSGSESGMTGGEEINPFLSIMENEQVNEKFHGVARIFSKKDEEKTVEKNEEDPEAMMEEDETSPFRENTHTYDAINTAETINAELRDPLKEIESFETAVVTDNEYTEMETTSVERTRPNTKLTFSGTTKFTGTLNPGRPNKHSGYEFGFWLVLDNGQKLKLNTQRDLRNVIGKTLSIEVEGTEEAFALKHVYFSGNKKLAQSGPEALLIFTAMLAFAFAWFRRKA